MRSTPSRAGKARESEHEKSRAPCEADNLTWKLKRCGDDMISRLFGRFSAPKLEFRVVSKAQEGALFALSTAEGLRGCCGITGDVSGRESLRLGPICLAQGRLGFNMDI